MVRRSSVIAIAAALGFGVAALALVPGQPSPVARVETADVAVTSVSSPNADLLRRLDAAVAPPKVVAEIKTPKAVDGQVATVQPVSLNAGADLAAPATPAPVAPTTPAAPAGLLKPDRVSGTPVNLRSGPSSSSQQISVLQPGEALQTGQTIGGWVQVTRADGSTGWVYSSYLASSGGSRTLAPKAQATRVASLLPRAVVGGDTGNLEGRTAHIASLLPAYPQPRDTVRPIFTFQPGDQVRIAEVRGGWMRVETYDGISAWIRR